MSERFQLVSPHSANTGDWECRRLPHKERAIVDFGSSSGIPFDELKPGMIIECEYTHAYIEIAVGAKVVTDAAAINGALAQHKPAEAA